MKITFVCSKETDIWDGCYWRCYVPFLAINKTRRHQANILDFQEFNENGKRTKRILNESDIIIIHRYLWGDVLTNIQHWKALGKTVVADLDLAIDLIPPSSPDFKFWHEGVLIKSGRQEIITPSPLTQLKWGLQLVDGVTVSTKRLADDWCSYGNSRVIPNFLDLNLYSNIVPRLKEGINIGWKGKISQLDSLISSGAFNAVMDIAEVRKNIKLLICTNSQPDHPLINRHRNKINIRLIHDISEWYDCLANIDIGIAPLANDFDQRSSWLPVLEYSAARIPWIGSRSFAYQDLQPFGWLVDNKLDVWKRILWDIVEHLEDYKVDTMRNAFLFGLSKSIDDNLILLLDTYSELSNNYLNSELIISD